MKRILLIILIMLSIIKISAKEITNSINEKDIIPECYYDDGGIYSSRYNISRQAYYITRTSFDIGSNPVNKYIFKGDGAKDLASPNSIIGQDFRCRKYIIVGISTKDEKDGDNDTDFLYGFVKATDDLNEKLKFNDFDFQKTGFISSTDKGKALRLAVQNQVVYSLVNQRYKLITNNSSNPNLCYFKFESKDSIVDSTYIVHKYDNYSFIGRQQEDYYSILDETSTSVLNKACNNPDKKIYTNTSEINTVNTSSGIIINPRFSQDKTGKGHIIIDKQLREEPDYIYNIELTSITRNRENNLFGEDELCSVVLKNTSGELKKIIPIMYFVSIGLTIVLIANDLLNAVRMDDLNNQSGKILKKIKTKIFALIILLCLSIITKLTINVMKKTGAPYVDKIQYIDCLIGGGTNARN